VDVLFDEDLVINSAFVNSFKKYIKTINIFSEKFEGMSN
jgi:hypothetical protein